MNITISKITLAQLYEQINKSLKSSGCGNEEVTIRAQVKLTVGVQEATVPLKIIDITAKIDAIPQVERDKMSGMYPPTKRAEIFINCEIAENEHQGS